MRKLLLTSAAALLIGACGLPFGIGHPSTSDLEKGAADSLASAKSFETKATYQDGGKAYDLDIEYARPTIHIAGKQGDNEFEMLSFQNKTYYKGRAFLTSLLVDPNAVMELKGSDDRWVTGTQLTPVDSSAITDPGKTRLLLSGPAANRQDDVSFDGQNTAELTLPAAIVNITESTPYRLLRLRSIPGQSQEGVSNVDAAFSNYNQSFTIAAPTNAFDLDDPSTWPPLYRADSVHQETIPNTNSCNDPCVLGATMENIGGVNGASSPSTVTFSLTSDADNSSLGSCKVTIQPDRPHGQQFSVSCSIQSAAWTNFSGNYHYRADVDNPAYD